MAEEFYYSTKYMQDEEEVFPAKLNERGMVEISEKELRLIRSLFFAARYVAELYIKGVSQGQYVAMPEYPFPIPQDLKGPTPEKPGDERPLSVTIDPNGEWKAKIIQNLPPLEPGEFNYYDNNNKVQIGKVNDKVDLDFWLAWYKWYLKRKKMALSRSLYAEIALLTGRSVQHVKNYFQIVKGQVDT